MNDNNTLHFSITIDGSGLKEIETKSVAAFNGIKKGVQDLSSVSVSNLQTVSLEVMYAVDKFNKLAKAVGINPTELRQTLNYLREMRAEQEKLEKTALTRAERISNAEAKLIRQQIANLEAERRAKEKANADEVRNILKLGQIERQSINQVSKMRFDAHSQFINQINDQNKRIKDQAGLMLSEMNKVFGNKKGFGGGFGDGFKNVFSGNNNGTFSNILGGFGGGGRFGGTIASSLDGAFAGGSGGAAGLLGGLAAGAGIGIGIAALTALISAIKSASEAIVEFTKNSIKAAADFELTVNSIGVFAGGINAANKELELLNQTVENTNGLSLEGAERGYKQLRALGFEAENSRKLIEGLGKIKITSGATDQSVERVIVNLTQLSATTARAGQDIKEIIHALPAMRAVFRDAFGSADSGTIKAAIDRDGDEAFKKLADAMANAKGASGGMNDALTKLNNEWIIIQREFGKPIIPVLTNAFKDLTSWLKANRSEFASWGQVVAAIFRGAVISAKAFNTAMMVNYPKLYNLGSRLAQKLGIAESDEAKKIREQKAIEEERIQQLEDLKTKEEINSEKRRVRELKSVEDVAKLKSQVIENAFKIEEAMVNAAATYTINEEIAKMRKLGEIRKNSLRAQLAFEIESLDKQIKLQNGNEEKIADLYLKKDEIVNKFNSEIIINTINSQREIAEAERKQLEMRRAAYIDLYSFMADQAKFGFDQVTNTVERQLKNQQISTTEGYNQLRDVTVKYYAELRRYTADRYAIQLSDQRLTIEQRFNLEAKKWLEDRKIAEDGSRALIELEEKRWQETERLMKESVSRTKEYYESQSGIYSAIGNLFDTSTFSSSTPEKLNSALGLDVIDKRIAEIKEKLPKLVEARKKAAEELLKFNYSAETPEVGSIYSNLATAEANATTEMNKLNEELETLQKKVPSVYREFVQLSEGIGKGTSSFDQVRKKLLDIKQLFERADLKADIDLVNSLIALENTKPEKDRNFGKLRELNAELGKLTRKETTLGLQQQAEAIELYSNSVEGLKESIEKLQSGDGGSVNGVLDGVTKQILQERKGLLEENIELEARIATVGDDSAARYRNAWLRAIYDVKEASIEARESQIESQVKIAEQTEFSADKARATILESMAGAKGYTEIFADAFLSINQKITDGISGLIGKATDGLGAFGEVLGNIASQLLTMVTNRLMMRLLDMILPPSSPTGTGVGGFSLGNIGGSLLGILTGSGGFGAMNMVGGGNSSLINSILPTLNSIGNGGLAANTFTSVSSITSGDTLTGMAMSGARNASSTVAHEAIHSTAARNVTGGLGGLFSNFSLGNLGASLGASLGAMAPMLGLSLGSSLGGQSVAGQIVGGAGGLLAGLAPTLLGLGGLIPIAGLAIAPLLLIGAKLLGRNKQRREDEKLRTTYLSDAFTNLDDILAKVKSHEMGGDEGIKAAESVRETYREQAAGLKDKKTRNIALKEINDRINPKIEAIKAAAKIASEDKERFDDRIPEFATGGIVPGRFGEPRLVLAHGGEIIANPSQQTPAFLAAAADSGIPGVGRGTSGSGIGGNGNPQCINVQLVIGTDTQDQLYVNGAKSTKGYNLNIEQNKKAQKFRDMTF